MDDIDRERDMEQVEQIREALELCLEILEDEYDGAPDSTNRHWGSIIIQAKAALNKGE